jgi:hypothetical protein
VINIRGERVILKIAIELGFKNQTYFIRCTLPKYDIDLSDLHTGMVRCRGYFNSRLRSPKSIERELLNIVDGFYNYLNKKSDLIIIDSLEVTGKIIGDRIMVLGESFKLYHVRSLESNLTLSWHNAHDIFNTEKREVRVIAKRESNTSIRYYMKDSDLYDFSKLKKLSESDSFKNRDFTFFRYNELKRLVGIPVDGNIKAISGLFR